MPSRASTSLLQWNSAMDEWNEYLVSMPSRASTSLLPADGSVFMIFSTSGVNALSG